MVSLPPKTPPVPMLTVRSNFHEKVMGFLVVRSFRQLRLLQRLVEFRKRQPHKSHDGPETSSGIRPIQQVFSDVYRAPARRHRLGRVALERRVALLGQDASRTPKAGTWGLQRPNSMSRNELILRTTNVMETAVPGCAGGRSPDLLPLCQRPFTSIPLSRSVSLMG